MANRSIRHAHLCEITLLPHNSLPVLPLIKASVAGKNLRQAKQQMQQTANPLSF
jgi:hypothetical protein